MPYLYRKRLIPEECILLEGDKIVELSDKYIISTWETLRPKSDFSTGISLYCIQEGWKISKFFKADGSLCYIYCDIIDTDYNRDTDTYIFTDLLADVIIYPDNSVHVVDLDELADVLDADCANAALISMSLRRLSALLNIIEDGSFADYIRHLEKYQ